MRRVPQREWIRIRGARQNNLQGFDLDLPTRSLIVVTGLSGSGKSSLAFDTLYAEGQRRYIETFSPYARQFFDRMDKPRVDSIEGIPPAIALEQRNSVRTTRSTVGTMTEVCDHLKVLWPRLARLHCRQCHRPVVKESPRDVWERTLANLTPPGDALVTFQLPLSAKLSLAEQLALVAKQGFQRLLLDGQVRRLDELTPDSAPKLDRLTIIQDRLKLSATQRSRFVEACEQAYHFGHGKLRIVFPSPQSGAGETRWTEERPYSQHLHCATCDLEYQEPSPALFSFNHPIGACPHCKGFGRIISIDYDRAIPDRSKTLAEGAVKPWQTETGAECQTDLTRAARKFRVPMDVPFRELTAEQQRWVIEGDPEYGGDNTWPKAWYGVKGYFRYLESKAYKMHVRVLLSRYRAYVTCPHCRGRRLQPDALLWLWTLPNVAPAALPSASPAANESPTSFPVPAAGTPLTLADFYALPIDEALRLVRGLAEEPSSTRTKRDPFSLALEEVQARLEFLAEVGLGYLTLDRATRTLSGGETQRVNLTTCLGSRLVHTLFVLDEPSVGLHFRDTERLVRILIRLRDLGNTVVVVEHEPAVMRAADQIIDLGPGHGESGGRIVVQGTYAEVLRHPTSLTAAYLSGRRRIELPVRRAVPAGIGSAVATSSRLALAEQSLPYHATPGALSTPPPEVPALRLNGVTRHNLANFSVAIPLGRLVCLSGVSGSGKTTLAGELLRLLHEHLRDDGRSPRLDVREDEKEDSSDDREDPESDQAGEALRVAPAKLTGAEHLGAVLLVDQSPIGRTPRSNPAVYTGAFDHLRDLFAQSEVARQRGLNASAFSFNSAVGQCEQCRGAGFEKIEMQFLSDIFIRCQTCLGRRYRPHILEVRIAATPETEAEGKSIADLLETSVDDALPFLASFPSPAAARASACLRLLQDVGLGYLRLGQPINTLSGGESQRLKLAGHLAGSAASPETPPAPEVTRRGSRSTPPVATKPTLFVFDEPTTGLHFEDIRILLQAFQRLVNAGHSVLIIEHNLEVLKAADWLIDLGPDGGLNGGRLVAAGTPEAVAARDESHTGQALRSVLPAS